MARFSQVEVEERVNLAKRNVVIAEGNLELAKLELEKAEQKDKSNVFVMNEIAASRRKVRYAENELEECKKAVDTAHIHPDEYDEIAARIMVL